MSRNATFCDKATDVATPPLTLTEGNKAFYFKQFKKKKKKAQLHNFMFLIITTFFYVFQEKTQRAST